MFFTKMKPTVRIASFVALCLFVFIGQSEAKKKIFYLLVDKQNLELNVCSLNKKECDRLATYPINIGKVKGKKTCYGDKKTPEGTFKIMSIENSSNWKRNFGDGRGAVRAYGKYFLRLKTVGYRGIGIHGSTNNEDSVPGRTSTGCIRLHDKDIKELTEKYAFVGMKVVILKD